MSKMKGKMIFDSKVNFYHPPSCKLHCVVDLPQILRGMVDFSGVEAQSFCQILDSAHIQNYAKNTTICYKDDACNVLFYLFHGTIKSFKVNKYGNEAIVNLYTSECAAQGNPPLLNYEAFCDGIAKTTLQSLEPCRILSIQIDALKELLKDDIALANNFINRANAVICELNYFAEISLMDSHAKVCSLMQKYPNIFKSTSKKLIASLLNISQETLSRTLREIV